MTQDVLNQLDPSTADDDLAMEAGRLRRKLEGVVRGNRLVVGAHRNKNCDLKRLTPKTDEVWEIRERDQPSIRVFFRFIERDCLATTNLRLVKQLFAQWWLRNGLDYFPGWVAEISRCKAIWRTLFLTYLPHSGVMLSDYLSNATGPSTF